MPSKKNINQHVINVANLMQALGPGLQKSDVQDFPPEVLAAACKQLSGVAGMEVACGLKPKTAKAAASSKKASAQKKVAAAVSASKPGGGLPCPPGYEVNPKTGMFRLACPAGKKRNSNDNCVVDPCPVGKERNPLTGRCWNIPVMVAKPAPVNKGKGTDLANKSPAQLKKLLQEAVGKAAAAEKERFVIGRDGMNRNVHSSAVEVFKATKGLKLPCPDKGGSRLSGYNILVQEMSKLTDFDANNLINNAAAIWRTMTDEQKAVFNAKAAACSSSKKSKTTATKAPKAMRDCPEGKEWNPVSGMCRNVCVPGKTRNPTGNCVNVPCPGKSGRPLNGYTIFVSEMRKRGSTMEEIGGVWKTLGDDEKDFYKRKAASCNKKNLKVN